MKSESVIFLNPNQLILMRNLQEKICATASKKIQKTESLICVPALPICVKSDDLKENSKITKAAPSKIYIEENKIFLKVGMEIDGCESCGKIELCEMIFENAGCTGTFGLKSEDFSAIWEDFAPKIKKISPFRLVQIETEEFANGRTWKVTDEKWVKIT